MAYLILVRHGQSEWNLLNKFTGHTNVELTEQGKKEAQRAAELIMGIPLHKAYTSDLKRAQQTLDIILEKTNMVTFKPTSIMLLKSVITEIWRV